jgi:hypothetical protein
MTEPAPGRGAPEDGMSRSSGNTATGSDTNCMTMYQAERAWNNQGALDSFLLDRMSAAEERQAP